MGLLQYFTTLAQFTFITCNVVESVVITDTYYLEQKNNLSYRINLHFSTLTLTICNNNE